MQGVPPDVATPYVPPLHCVHEVWPELDAYVPKAQEGQDETSEPAGEDVPTGQAVQTDEEAAE